MDEAQRLRELAGDVEDLCTPVRTELSRQLESGDFAGALADEAEGVVDTVSATLNSFAESLRDAADSRAED